jgi:hypothetical protein
MSVFKNIPGRNITDPETGIAADVVETNGVKRLAVDSRIIGGSSITVAPPSDRRFLTLTVTGVPQAMTFPGFSIKGINIKSSQDSSGTIRIGESTLLTTNEYTILQPGEAYGAEVNGTLNPIFVVFDTGTTAAIVHIAVLGDPA